MKLQLKAIVAQFKAPSQIINLDYITQDIEEVEQLDSLTALQKINFSHNKLTTYEFIRANTSLVMINFSHNAFQQIIQVQPLLNLTVLNLSNNQIEKIENLQSLKNLKALILNNNKISQIQHLEQLRELNTLVLSSNNITQMSNLNLPMLEQLSLSHNLIQQIQCTNIIVKLQELKINDNQIKFIDQQLIQLGRLEILDLGQNQITNSSFIKILGGIQRLRNLNIDGNPFLQPVQDQSVVNEIPSLRIFNFQRLDGGKPKNVEKSEEGVKSQFQSTISTQNDQINEQSTSAHIQKQFKKPDLSELEKESTQPKQYKKNFITNNSNSNADQAQSVQKNQFKVSKTQEDNNSDQKQITKGGILSIEKVSQNFQYDEKLANQNDQNFAQAMSSEKKVSKW